MESEKIKLLKESLSNETDPTRYLEIERELEDWISRARSVGKEHEQIDVSVFDETFTQNGGEGTRDTKPFADFCPQCKKRLLMNVSESVLVCEKCGYFTNLFDYSSQNLSYDQTQNIDNLSSCSYKRINHFNEFLSLMQAKESSKISEDVLDIIREQCKKERIDPKTVKVEKVRAILKQKKLSKYYDNVAQIMATFTDESPVSIPPHLEDSLRNMFDAIQEPFNRHKPPTRTNFLSYNYVLYKFCELMGERELMKQFSLLKSREKLYEQDQLWKLICLDLGWEFRKTI